MMMALAVFLTFLASEYVWTRWMQAVAGKQAIAAGLWSAGTVAMGAVGVLAYVESPWFLAPACLGAFVGAWATVRG